MRSANPQELGHFLSTVRNSHATQKAYRATLNEFLRFAGRCASGAVSTPLLRQWLKHQARRSPQSGVCTRARHLDHFLQWRQNGDAKRLNPFAELRRQYGCGKRSMGRMVDALLTEDHKAALEKLRPLPRFGSVFGPHMQADIELKRAMGYRYRTEEKAYLHFDRFLQEHRELIGQPLQKLVQAWGRTKRGISATLRAQECGRNLSKTLNRLDPTVPLLTIDPRLRRQLIERQRRPHVYSDSEINQLLKAALTMSSERFPWKPLMLYTILILVYCAGLRIGELARLTLANVHLDDGSLEIRETKFFKSRRLPLAPSVVAVLRNYLHVREESAAPGDLQSGLFWNPGRDRCYALVTLRTNVVKVIRRAGLKPLRGLTGPRIHDLRHTFVLHRMRDWSRRGINTQARLPYLAAYLGHVNISSTLSYLTQTEELKQIASERFRRARASAVCAEGVQP
jgi:integrase